MNTTISEILKKYATEHGMKFMSGHAKQMTETKLSFPLIWLEPLVLTQRAGRKDGTATFRVKLHIMQLNSNFPKKPLEEAWDEMMAIAINLFDSLADNPDVICTKNLSCAPATSRMTNYGELAVTAAFDVDTTLFN